MHRPKVEGASRYAGFVLQAQGTTVSDIYEARLAIEPFTARRLAQTRPPGATDRLRDETDRLTLLVNERRYVDFMIGLVEFHRLLVELGGNQTLLFVTNILQDVTARYQVDRLKRRPISEDVQRQRALWGIRSFQRLIALIEQGEADGAEKHWHLHIKNSNASWVTPEDAQRLVDLLD